MAVYTHVSKSDLTQHLKRFDIGTLVSFHGVTDGVENTNYRLTTTEGDFILTLTEKRVNEKDLPFFISFMEHLRGKEIPCPRIISAVTGEKTTSLCGRPSLISTFLQGASPEYIEPFHATEAGKMLAKMHLTAADFELRRDNEMALPAWKGLITKCENKPETLEKGLTSLLQEELSYIEKNLPQNLPFGAVHADLFPDNVFFTGEKISGIIDFYFSCTDIFVYDLMLTLNAWCRSPEKTAAFLRAYQAVRPLSTEEKESLIFFGRAAALRIIATRLYDYLHPVEGAVVKTKDPMEYVDILKFYRAGKFSP